MYLQKVYDFNKRETYKDKCIEVLTSCFHPITYHS